MRKLFSIVFSAVLLLIGSAQGTWAQKAKVYDLGHYPNGTWAWTNNINNSGVVVGRGDVPPMGYTHPIGVPLFGPKAGQWFDLGTLGGDRSDSEVSCEGIADTGLIVGTAAITGGESVHAFAWTQKSGMVDLGTLVGNTYSYAAGTNKTGTLIAGWSGNGFFTEDTVPVVWTPKVVWTSRGPTTTWSIQKLDTEGIGSVSYWEPMGVNNLGQIVGAAMNSEGFDIALLWNPVPGGKGWKVMQLPASPPEYPQAWTYRINDNGVIVGAVASPDGNTALPSFWQKKSPSGSIWNLTVLATPSGSPYSEASSINDRGDIVGYTFNTNWYQFATRWSTKEPTVVQLLDFPGAASAGAWSIAIKVNDNRIAVGPYGNDTIPVNAFAVQFGPE
jgi:probable HAF family extracellular repeat protein